MTATIPTNSPPRETVAPLLETFERVRAVNPYLQVSVGPLAEANALAASAFLANGGELLDQRLAVMAEHYKTTDPEVLARFFFRHYAYRLATVSVSPLVLDHRVPVLDLHGTGFTLGDWGSPSGIVLDHDAFYCLPDDAAAGHDHARVVADAASLRGVARAMIVAMCEPLIDALRRRARLGARALWICVAEMCAGVLLDALPATAADTTARAEVVALIGDPASPLRAKPDVLSITANGRIGLAILGSDCCANFRLEGEGYCDTCPHKSYGERLTALHNWIGESGKPIAG